MAVSATELRTIQNGFNRAWERTVQLGETILNAELHPDRLEETAPPPLISPRDVAIAARPTYVARLSRTRWKPWARNTFRWLPAIGALTDELDHCSAHAATVEQGVRDQRAAVLGWYAVQFSQLNILLNDQSLGLSTHERLVGFESAMCVLALVFGATFPWTARGGVSDSFVDLRQVREVPANSPQAMAAIRAARVGWRHPKRRQEAIQTELKSPTLPGTEFSFVLLAIRGLLPPFTRGLIVGAGCRYLPFGARHLLLLSTSVFNAMLSSHPFKTTPLAALPMIGLASREHQLSLHAAGKHPCALVLPYAPRSLVGRPDNCFSGLGFLGPHDDAHRVSSSWYGKGEVAQLCAVWLRFSEAMTGLDVPTPILEHFARAIDLDTVNPQTPLAGLIADIGVPLEAAIGGTPPANLEALQALACATSTADMKRLRAQWDRTMTGFRDALTAQLTDASVLQLGAQLPRGSAYQRSFFTGGTLRSRLCRVETACAELQVFVDSMGEDGATAPQLFATFDNFGHLMALEDSQYFDPQQLFGREADAGVPAPCLPQKSPVACGFGERLH